MTLHHERSAATDAMNYPRRALQDNPTTVDIQCQEMPYMHVMQVVMSHA